MRVVTTAAVSSICLVLALGGVARADCPRGGTGTVTFAASPWGSVAVDGKPRGQTPLKLSLSGGTHAVSLTRGMRTERAQICVRKGKTVAILWDSEKPGPLLVDDRPAAPSSPTATPTPAPGKATPAAPPASGKAMTLRALGVSVPLESWRYVHHGRAALPYDELVYTRRGFEARLEVARDPMACDLYAVSLRSERARPLDGEDERLGLGLDFAQVHEDGSLRGCDLFWELRFVLTLKGEPTFDERGMLGRTVDAIQGAYRAQNKPTRPNPPKAP